MSGKKRILVDESEWYRLQKRAKIDRETKQLAKDVRRQVEEDLEIGRAHV